MKRKYWKGINELKATSTENSIDQEFPASNSVQEFMADDSNAEASTGRRDFLKFLGFSVAAATVAACEAPVVRAIPYVNKPENVTPGMPTWYASVFYDGNSYANILVKTREGRPIYVKGNADFGLSRGAVNSQIIASVLGLYNGARLQNPKLNGKDVKYSEIDGVVSKALKGSKKVVLVSSSMISPSLNEAVNELSLSLGGSRDEMGAVSNDNFEHIQYDAISYAGIRQANKELFGLTTAQNTENGIIPDYDFSKAKTIISFGADFLNSWLMPTQFSAQYATTRKPDGEWMSKHYQFESIMSITGSNADVRGMIKPSEEAGILAEMLKAYGKSTGGVSPKVPAGAKKAVESAIKSLKSSKGHSLVVSGSNNAAIQMMVNELNLASGAYNHTININNEINLFQSNDSAMNKLVDDVIAGKGPDAIIFHGTNPVYSHPKGAEFGAKLKDVKHTISTSLYNDETASKCKALLPDLHSLEAWRDFNPTKAEYSLAQPTIRPLFNTASATETFLVLAGKATRGGKDSTVSYDLIKNLWIQYGYPDQTVYTDPETYFSAMAHNTVSAMPVAAASLPTSTGLSGIASKLPKGGGTEVVLYQKAGLGNGQHAANPWLQELPDPMTKITWDNYVTMSPEDMKEQNFPTYVDQEHGLNLAKVTIGKKEITLPVCPLPGQAAGTIGIALGYGRGAGLTPEDIGTAAFQTKEYGGNVMTEDGFGDPVGQNAFPISSTSNGTIQYTASGAKIENTGEEYLVAMTQIQGTAMGRHSIVRETTLDIYKDMPKEAYNAPHQLAMLDEHGNHVMKPVEDFDLWEAHPVEHIGHRWGMTIDLNQCFGCGACLISCQSENNVPVVGKDEVRRGREMHWLRIDRYYASTVDAAIGTRKDHDQSKIEWFAEAEKTQENPQVIHMPMMCQHCNHAPCETVCPVAATTHSNEGLNQMTYNRCIGTRYCANNCPYKVRRFNWFNYPSYKKFTQVNPAQDDLGRMVLNPDVTVRTRGVMEKCSMCVQRVQAGKLEAKMEGRPVADGDYSTACADACPSDAIIVGDWNDVNSKLRKASGDKRSYQALEEIGVKPNIWYQVKVRNEKNDVLRKIQEEELHAFEKKNSHGGGHGEGHEGGHGDEHGAHAEGHSEGHNNNHH